MLRTMQAALTRESTPLPSPGTENSIWPQVSAFWSETFGPQGLTWSPSLIERIWVVNRCLQLCAQQIASMPLRFQGTFEPAWVTSPDPNWFPNGIGDAVFAITWHLYGWGDAFLIVSDRYFSGFPRSWTLAHPSRMEVDVDSGGRRRYRIGERIFPRGDVVQITRNPTGGLRGTSALAAYASSAWNVAAGAETTNDVLNNLPPAVLKSKTKRLTKDQAVAVQSLWSARASVRTRGVPPVLDPDLDLVATNLGFTPKDLLLLEAQEFDARVIASAFGVPASLLNMAVSGGLTYQNPAMLGEQWWRFELLPGPAKRIADAMTANLLPAGNSVLFDASATFSPLDEPDEGLPESPVAGASPAQQDIPQLRPVEARA
jgi:HK97 family phage portal protein